MSTQAAPGGPFDDRPPLIAWTAPAAGASLTANEPTTLAVNATDDRGLARVQFFDDDRLVCEDTAAPYTCAYQPRGGDVGRNTLIAVADRRREPDHELVRAVTVRRFRRRASRCAAPEPRPPRALRVPRHRAAAAAEHGVAVAGLLGHVTITAKAGHAAPSPRARAKLSRTCEYAPDAALPLAAREPAAPDRPASAATTCWPRRTSRGRTARLG